ncbi:carbohydrate ABC transporter permease [Microbacterium sp. C23T]
MSVAIRPHTARSATAARWTAVAPYVFIAPFGIVFAVFGVVPMLATIVLAMSDGNVFGEQHWVGIDNFTRLLDDPRFWLAARNTLGILVLAVVPQVVLATVLAHTIVGFTRRAAFTRVSLLVPYVTSSAAVALVAAQLVDRDFGLLSAFARAVGAPAVDLLSTPLGSWVAIAGMITWRWFGFTTLLMVAVLESVPREIYAAAEVDGAGWWSQLRFLSLPLLRPAVVFSGVTSIVAAVQLFAEPLLVRPGGVTCGPARQCQTLALLVYEVGFREFQFGYASAITVVVLLLTVAAVGLLALVGRVRAMP